MVNIIPVECERHAGKGWRQSQDWSFAAFKFQYAKPSGHPRRIFLLQLRQK
jgi:hypothetical protein